MLTIAIANYTESSYGTAFNLERVVGPFSNQRDAERYLCQEGFRHHGLDWVKNDTWEKTIDFRSKECAYFCPLQPIT